MATCRDCIHYDVCHNNFKNIDLNEEMTDEHCCVYFKDKSRFIELPNIEIGQELFYIDQYEKRVKSDTVSKLTFEKNDLGIDTGVFSEDYGFSMFFSDVGKSLFLTKEEAEAKLKELKE